MNLPGLYKHIAIEANRHPCFQTVSLFDASGKALTLLGNGAMRWAHPKNGYSSTAGKLVTDSVFEDAVFGDAVFGDAALEPADPGLRPRRF